jgi:sugar lactone lactonase YvrE
MVVELIAAGALSADPAPCTQNSPRLNAIAAALERRPTDATLYFWEAATWADCRQLGPTLAALDKVRDYGEGFLPIEPIGFARVWNEPEFQKRRAAFERSLPQAGLTAPVAVRFQGKDLIPEGVAYDPTTRSVYLGSIAQKRIVRMREGRQETFAAKGLDAVLGLAADPKARRLYAVSTNGIFPTTAPPLNQVAAFDLDSGALLRTVQAKDAGQLNDLAVAADGTVYVTDSRAGRLYVARAADAQLESFLPAGTLNGANGLALSADQRSLFVAHATGVARVTLSDKTVTPIVNATRETIAAIDGLYVHGGRLVGVQNAVQPGRVIRITLDEGGLTATAVETLLSHHHRELDEPTTGAIDGHRFLLLANSFVGALDDSGKLRPGVALRDPVILEVSLR